MIPVRARATVVVRTAIFASLAMLHAIPVMRVIYAIPVRGHASPVKHASLVNYAMFHAIDVIPVKIAIPVREHAIPVKTV